MKEIFMDQFKKFAKQSSSTVLAWDLKKLSKQFFVVAIILAFGTSIFWYKDIYMSHERRFWLAIDNSMSTDSVVRTLTSGGTGNEVVQDNRFYFSPQNLAESRVGFSNISATVKTSVVTEGISTLQSQYSRYVSFQTNDPRPDGTIPSLDSVLGQWSGQSASGEGLEEARLNYVSELVTLAIFGNFDATYRNEVIRTLKENSVYDVSFDKTIDEAVDGFDVLLYPAKVKLKAYAGQLQNSFIQAGLGEFPPLDPDNYREDATIAVTIAVRKKDNAIVGIKFGDRQEKYTNYGVQKRIVEPVPAFTPQELEAEVQRQIQG
jgi:hypothetical protein